MLKNILLVLLILFPAALYIYMISRDDGTKQAEQTSHPPNSIPQFNKKPNPNIYIYFIDSQI